MPISFQITAIPQLFVGIFLLTQGILILIQNPRSTLHRAFFFLQFPVFIWQSAMGAAFMLIDQHDAFILSKIGFLGVLYIPICTYIFSVYYRGEGKQRKRIYAGLGATTLLAFFINHPLFASGVYSYWWGYYIKLGPLSLCALGLFAYYIPLFIFNLYKKYQTASREQKPLHFRTLLTGSFAFFAILDFLPAYGINLMIPPIGYIVVGTFVTLMGYYIIRYHLTDLKITVGRTLGYILLTAILGLIYTSFFVIVLKRDQTGEKVLVHAMLFIGALYTLSFLKQKSQIIIDQLFFKEKINFPQHIGAFTLDLRNLTNTTTLLQSLFNFLNQNLRVSPSIVLILEPQEMRWIVYENTTMNAVKPQLFDATPYAIFKKYFLNNTETIDKRKFMEKSQLSSVEHKITRLLKRVNGEIAIPLVRHASFLGFIILGSKASREAYTQWEIISLNNLGVPFAIAWENAKLYEEVQNANKLKSDFVSITSHQLRTPLTAIRWSLTLLSEKGTNRLTDEQKNFLQTIATSTERMIAVVNQLLDIARLENETVTYHTAPVSLLPLIQDIAEGFKKPFAKKKIAFKIDMPYHLPLIQIVEEQIKTVLSIFLDNALRYTPALGSVTCGAKKAEQHITVFVKDTGIGIPKNQQINIFKKFYRATNAVSTEPAGNGLGLYYAKALIEKQDGYIWFRSEEGKGTTFYTSLPIVKK